ncbi:cytoplasmic protein [Roseibium limicola]|uniref:Cytoplasmic protein n=1 Tax=Roseibium limicola TaxID=2816037 RepID=A0A939EJI7_9HYPH|nr:cytoplasmic protein [Roseibium limicola]MBO0343810.1 cytoplasmic protein [Roseibium limicola]
MFTADFSATLTTKALRAAALAACTAIAFAFPAAAHADLPACDTPSVMSKVEAQLARAERTYRDTNTLTVLESPYEMSMDDNNQASTLNRRYCSARIETTASRSRTVYYMVEENAGFLGLTWGVEACQPGMDDWRVYGRHCQTVRPD